MIAFDSEKVIGDMLRSIEPHIDDLVIAIDPKTRDRTREIVQEWGERSKVLVTLLDGVDPLTALEREKPDLAEDGFAAARNLTFQVAIRIGCEWLLWIDTDDILGTDMDLHDLVEQEGKADVAAIWLPYLYHRDRYGNVTTLFDRERLLNAAYLPIWKGIIHETCEPRREGGRYVRSEKAWIDQVNNPGTAKSDRNFALLRKVIDTDPTAHREVLYLAHQYFASHQWADAAEWYEKFVRMRSPGDVQHEKWQALIYLAKARRENGELLLAARAASTAMQMFPEYADSYFELAHACALSRQWQKAIEWHETGLTKKQPERILITNPLDVHFNPYAVIHTAYAAVGDHPKALDALTKCIELRPGDAELRWRGAVHLATWERRKATEAVLLAARHLLETDESLKAEAILECLPAGAEDEDSRIVTARVETAAAVAHLRAKEAYENFYFEMPEDMKVQTADVPLKYPRIQWVADRLRAAGAKRVLELGIGNATQACYLATHGIHVVGVDIDPKRVKAANIAAADLGLMPWKDAPDHTPPRGAEHPALCGLEPHTHSDEEGCFVPPDRDVACQRHVHVSACRHLDAWMEECADCGPAIRLPAFDAPEAKVEFHQGDALDIPERIRVLGPFDAVVASELIEHVEDVEGLLRGMESFGCRVLLTTPDGTYQGPRQRNPAHVRAWSRREMERLLAKRGRTVESRVLPHPLVTISDDDVAGGAAHAVSLQGNIAYEYVPGESRQDRPPVAIYCGPGIEQWSPDSIDTTGLGGSETAVVRLADELARRGMRVAVYAEAEGVWNSVTYRKWQRWSPDMPVWALISWRNPALFDRPIAANLRLLWMHDTDHGDQITPERMESVHAVMCMSAWHRRHLEEMYPYLAGKCFIVGNGIDPSRFEREAERDLHRVVYLSSPDRGLEQALGYWPLIRERDPLATFHIYYGWDNYDRMGGGAAYKAKIRKMADQEGVTWHGRIGQWDLASELLGSSVLLYPGPHPFCETFCISVIEAAAAGCVPVTRDNGALPETNQYGVVVANDALPERWVNATLSAMKARPRLRRRIAQRARTVTWTQAARRLIERLGSETKRLTDDSTTAPGGGGVVQPEAVLSGAR